MEEELALGRDWTPDVPQSADVVTLDSMLDAYIDHRALRLRDTTLRRYRENIKLFRRFVQENFHGKDVSPAVLSKPLLEAYYTWLLQPETGLYGRKREADTARKIAEVAQLAWKWADDSERWPDVVRRPRTIEMVRAQSKPVIAPTWGEMDAVVLSSSGWIRCLAVWLRYTGLRVGESMQVLWSNVNLHTGQLTIRPEVDKSKRGRVIPLSPHLIADMGTWGVRQGYVIPETGKGGARTRQAVAKYMRYRWAKAGIRAEAWSGDPHHAFRKDFKFEMLALGAHPDAVDYLQGHKLGTGARGSYIDPWQALRLSEVAEQIPKVTRQKVFPLAAVR